MSALETSLGADFSTENDRFRHREVIAALLAPWFAGRPLAEIREALRPTSVLWSTFRSFTDLTGADAQALRANPMMAEVDQPGIGTHLAPGSPLSLAGHARQPVQPAPQLGEHTDTVLTELLDLSGDDLASLHAHAVVGEPACGGTSRRVGNRSDTGE
jgi:2-methylfumaryl-CoA isomerase